MVQKINGRGWEDLAESSKIMYKERYFLYVGATMMKNS